MNILSSLLNFIGEFIGSNPEETMTTESKTIVGAINELDEKYDNIQTKVTNLAASDWTAANATFTSGVICRYGDVRFVNATVKLTSAQTAGNEFDIGTLTHSELPTGRAYSLGVMPQGTITVQSSGMIRCRPAFNLANNGNLYLKIIYMGNV